MMASVLIVTGLLAAILVIVRLATRHAHEASRLLCLSGLALLLILPLGRWLFAKLGWTLWSIPVSETSFAVAEIAHIEEGSWWQMAAWVWVAGAGVMFVRLLWRQGKVWNLCARARPLTRVQRQLLAKVLSISVEILPRVRMLDGLPSPCVAWRGAQLVLLPREAFSWHPDTLRDVLQHELEHVRRADALWKGLSEMAVALWWWHPLAHRTARRASDACEYVCDAAVLTQGREPVDYARSLLSLASRSPGIALAFAAEHSPSRLRERVKAVLQGAPRASRIAWLTLGVMVGSMGTIVVLSCLCQTSLQKHFPQPGARMQVLEEAQVRFDADPFPGNP